jgi:PKD domain-containing protein
MTTNMPLRALAALAAVSGALAIAPGTAAAAGTTQIFCVNAVSCPDNPTSDKLGLAGALSVARANGDPAEIYIGPKPDGTAYVGPFEYAATTTTSNSLKIKGQGRPVLTAPSPDQPVLAIRGIAHNEVRGLDIDVPAGGDGLVLEDSDADHVRVRSAVDDLQTHGIVMSGLAFLTDTRVDLAAGTGVQLLGGATEISSSRIEASTGVVGFQTDLRIDGSRVDGNRTAIQLVRGAGGQLSFLSDGLQVIDSELTTRTADSDALFLRDADALLTRTSVARLSTAPAPESTAFDIEAIDRDPDVLIATTVVGGYAHVLDRSAFPGHSAPLEVRDSEWARAGDVLGGTAAGTFVTSGLVDAPPRYVDRAAHDLRLRGGDKAIDLLTDGPLTFNETDMDGIAAVDGDGNGSLLTDAGAHEYRRRAPVIDSFTATAPHFAATASDPDGDSVELLWNFGDGAKAKGASIEHVYAPGTYTGQFVARDEAGVQTKKAFTVTIAEPEKPAPGDGADPGSTAPVPDPVVAPSGDAASGDTAPGATAPGGDAPAGGTAPGGTSGGIVAPADRLAPTILSARLKRRGARKAKLTISLSEAATVRIKIGRKTRTVALKAGRSTRRIKVGRRRAKVKIVAIDAAGNRSAVRRLKLRRG